MPGQKDPFHVTQGSDRDASEVDTRDLEAKNEATGRGPGEEPRDVRKAGGGVKGASMGGSAVGRYGPAPDKVVSDRERKPRGQDRSD